jgi:cytochrome oxidase Cu insertion factor (SCO1/SenC/PrrC family)
MRRSLLTLFSMGIAIALLMSACASDTSSSSTTSAPNAPRGYRPTPVRKTDTVALPDYAADPSGVAFPFKAAPGNLLVVYFGYLTCPDICPVTMADIAAGLEESGPTVARHIEVAFVTVDFERDTGPRMVDYLTHFFPNSTIHALRAADSLQLSAVTSEFGAQWQVDAHEPGAATYGVAHSGVTYVVDDRGQLVWEWPFGTTGPEVAATLNQLMDTVYSTS